jgi:hypothetical protein
MRGVCGDSRRRRTRRRWREVARRRAAARRATVASLPNIRGMQPSSGSPGSIGTIGSVGSGGGLGSLGSRGRSRSTAVPVVIERPASSVMVLDALDALRAPVRGTARLAPRQLEDTESTSSLLSALPCVSAPTIDRPVRFADPPVQDPAGAPVHPLTTHGFTHGHSHTSPHVPLGDARVSPLHAPPQPQPFVVARAVVETNEQDVWPPPAPFGSALALAPAPTAASAPSDWTLMESQLSVLLDRKRIRAAAKARLADFSAQLQAAVDGSLPPGPHVTRAAHIQALAVAVQSAQAEYAALKQTQAVEFSHAQSLTSKLQQRTRGLV